MSLYRLLLLENDFSNGIEIAVNILEGTIASISVLLFVSLFLIGSPYLFYKIPTIFNYQKTGITLASVVALLFVSTFIYIYFQDEFFSKSDSIELLAEQDIYLSDDLKIINNESSGGIDGYNQILILEISDLNTKKTISKFRKENNGSLTQETTLEPQDCTKQYKISINPDKKQITIHVSSYIK